MSQTTPLIVKQANPLLSKINASPSDNVMSPCSKALNKKKPAVRKPRNIKSLSERLAEVEQVAGDKENSSPVAVSGKKIDAVIIDSAKTLSA